MHSELVFNRTWQQPGTIDHMLLSYTYNLEQSYAGMAALAASLAWQLLAAWISTLPVTKHMQAQVSNNKSGSGRTICPYYDEIDAIIGTIAATHPLTHCAGEWRESISFPTDANLQGYLHYNFDA